jgi:hypothetical protein
MREWQGKAVSHTMRKYHTHPRKYIVPSKERLSESKKMLQRIEQKMHGNQKVSLIMGIIS